jgi:hypothetical protein
MIFLHLLRILSFSASSISATFIMLSTRTYSEGGTRRGVRREMEGGDSMGEQTRRYWNTLCEATCCEDNCRWQHSQCAM